MNATHRKMNRAIRKRAISTKLLNPESLLNGIEVEKMKFANFVRSRIRRVESVRVTDRLAVVLKVVIDEQVLSMASGSGVYSDILREIIEGEVKLSVMGHLFSRSYSHAKSK